MLYFNFGGCVALWATFCVKKRVKRVKQCIALRISGPFIQTKPNSQATDKNNDTTVLVSADIMRRSHSSSVSRVCESLRILHKDYRPDAEEGGIPAHAMKL